MSDPKRLLLTSDNEAARLILGSAREDAPAGAARRAWMAASVTAATGATVTTAVAGKGAGLAAKIAAALSFKWLLLIGVLGVGAAVGGGVAVRAVRERRTEDASRDTRAIVASTSMVRRPGSKPAAFPSSADAVEPATTSNQTENLPAIPDVSLAPPIAAAGAMPVSASPSLPAVAPKGAPDAPMEANGPTAHPSMSAELKSLDDARSALASHQADRALSLLETYADRFPRGALAQEAAILRIQALSDRGDHAAAREAARLFLGKNPDTPYAARIRALVGGDVAPPR